MISSRFLAPELNKLDEIGRNADGFKNLTIYDAMDESCQNVTKCDVKQSRDNRNSHQSVVFNIGPKMALIWERFTSLMFTGPQRHLLTAIEINSLKAPICNAYIGILAKLKWQFIIAVNIHSKMTIDV